MKDKEVIQAKRYVKIIFKKEAGMLPVFLTDVYERREGFIIGKEVKKDGGNAIKRVNGKRIDETKHLIGREAVEKIEEWRMSRKYAWLVKVD